MMLAVARTGVEIFRCMSEQQLCPHHVLWRYDSHYICNGYGTICIASALCPSELEQVMINSTLVEPKLAANDTPGKAHLQRRSTLARRLQPMLPLKSVLVVDDSDLEATALLAMLRLVVGHETTYHHAKTLIDARRVIETDPPDVLFLDDRLGHAVSAEVSVARIKAFGYERCPIVLSGMLTRTRTIELRKLEVADIIHKDDLDAVRIMEAMLLALEPHTNVGT